MILAAVWLLAPDLSAVSSQRQERRGVTTGGVRWGDLFGYQVALCCCTAVFVFQKQRYEQEKKNNKATACTHTKAMLFSYFTDYECQGCSRNNTVRPSRAPVNLF